MKYMIILLTLISNNLLAGDWRYGRDVAVSLSYDDGYPDNLDNAMTHLNAYGLRGTFYLNAEYVRVNRVVDIPRWRSAFLKGHEIGNHGLNHVCSGTTGYNTQAGVNGEIQTSNIWLNNNIGWDVSRTFAYPCGETVVQLPDGNLSETPYFEAVDRHHFIGRGVTGGLSINPTANLANDPADFRQKRLVLKAIPLGPSSTLEQVKTFLADPSLNGKWVIFIFHSVDGPVSPVSSFFHREVVKYLYQQRNRYWTVPVRDASNYIVRRKE